MTGVGDTPRLRIQPAPTDEELAAIAVAVTLLHPSASVDEAQVPLSKWLRAGRLEAVGQPGNARISWRPRT